MSMYSGVAFPSDGSQYQSPYQQPMQQPYPARQQPYPAQQHPQPFTPPQGGQINEGSITYTTSTGADGRVVYHPFKAVPATYQTPSGVVSGIQWVPAEATQILPAGAQPANAEFAASWNRGYLSKGDQKALKDWQRDEEKRRKKEEKESKRAREKDRHGRGGVEDDLRKARERDAQASMARRNSFNAGAHSPVPGYPAAGPPGVGAYGNTPSGYPYGTSDLDNRFGDLDLDRREHERERERKISGVGRPRQYSGNEPDRQRKISGNYGDRPNLYSNNTHPAATRPYPTGGHPGGASPNMRPIDPPYATSGYTNPNYTASPRAGDPYPRSTSPFPVAMSPGTYPRGHILEGQPISRSRAPSPVGGPMNFPQPTVPGIVSPRTSPVAFTDHQQLAAPEGFSRPINAAQPYTPFETMKIQDMDEFLDQLPKMPVVLGPHDVLHEDWIRLMQDLSLAWRGKLPVPELAASGRAPKRATLTADLIDLWNTSFFLMRGVEVVLYKGRERRSGSRMGLIDLPIYDDADSLSSSSSSSSSSSESDLSGDDRYGHNAYGPYGRGPNADTYEAKRRQKEKKMEKRRRKKEKKARRKAKEREKTYALYITCVAQPGHGGAYGPGGPVGGIGGRMSPMPQPGGYAGSGPGIGGRISPMPHGGGYAGSGGGGGRISPMPHGGGYAGPGGGGRISPMPHGGGYAGPGGGGRTSPMPHGGGYAGPGGGVSGRISPMPHGGGYAGSGGGIGGRMSPMPQAGGYAGPGAVSGRMSPMPGYGGGISGRMSPMPGGGY